MHTQTTPETTVRMKKLVGGEPLRRTRAPAAPRMASVDTWRGICLRPLSRWEIADAPATAAIGARVQRGDDLGAP
jgi:hypothetical protein